MAAPTLPTPVLAGVAALLGFVLLPVSLSAGLLWPIFWTFTIVILVLGRVMRFDENGVKYPKRNKGDVDEFHARFPPED